MEAPSMGPVPVVFDAQVVAISWVSVLLAPFKVPVPHVPCLHRRIRSASKSQPMLISKLGSGTSVRFALTSMAALISSDEERPTVHSTVRERSKRTML